MSCLSLSNNTINLTQSRIGDETVQILLCFVVSDAGMSDNMKMSYETTKERFPDPDAYTVLLESECLNMSKASMREKKKIFIFDEFDKKNQAFMYVYNAKTVHILGSRCLLTILLENIPTPGGIFHIHNLTMRGLIITATSLSKEKKQVIRETVNFMGGHYVDALKDCVTHLVSESVRSVKYEMAAKNNVKIMHPTWVEDMWEKSKSTIVNVISSDEQFDRYKLPFFFNLCITSTGMKINDRNEIKTLVEENGGKYSASFTNAVDFLIMERDQIGCAKFNAATKLNKMCLTPAWVHDSIQNSYAMPFDNYKIVELKPSIVIKASTPTKANNVTVSKFNPDSTQLSNISRMSNFKQDISINETMASSSSKILQLPVQSQIDYKRVLEMIPLQEAKQIENLLDGFRIFLSGFTSKEQQRLGKVLSVLGATKLDAVNDQVSHIVVGATDTKLFIDLDLHNIEPMILKIDWLNEIFTQKRLVDETPFEILRNPNEKPIPAKPSPASKKALKILSGTFEWKKPPVPKLQLEARKTADLEEELDLINQYLQPAAHTVSTDDSQLVPFLTGKYVFVYGCIDAIQSAQIIEECERLGATLVDSTFKNEIDYVITPSIRLLEFKPNIRNFKYAVNDTWLVESVEAGETIQILFHHKPIAQMKEQPLKGEIFVVSNYKGHSRSYINMMVECLGGTYTEVLKKNDNAIVISPNAEGRKFESARTWNSAVLPVEWLAECIAKKRRIDETHFLIGGTTASRKNLTSNDSIIPSSQDANDQFDVYNPPVENDEDDVDVPAITPLRAIPGRLVNDSPMRTPKTPQLNMSRHLEDMSTPQREATRAAIVNGMQKKVVSPRKQRLDQLLNTPATRARKLAEEKPSPRPELPESMRQPDKDYGIRPDSSPNTQWFHKRKLEGLDNNYLPRPDRKKTKVEKEVNEPTPPFSHRRYDFFKARIEDYNSPNPRGTQTLDAEVNQQVKNTTNEASKFLNFDDDEIEKVAEVASQESEDPFKDFQEIDTRKSREKMKKPRTNKAFGEMCETESSDMFVGPLESEALVGWKDTDRVEVSVNTEDCVVVQGGLSQMRGVPKTSNFVFAFNSFDEKKRAELVERVESLGGAVDVTNYTHLITAKPNRSEKFLISIAAGRFILHLDYIDKCEEKGEFVSEDEYEFGNPKFLPPFSAEVKNEEVFKAPFKWRKWIKAEHKTRFQDGAFTGMAFIVAAAKNTSQFTNILEAGGGKIVDIDFKAPFKPAFLKRNKVEYCLMEIPKMLSKENQEVLKSCNVELLPIKHISQFLMSSDVPKKRNI